MARRAPPILRPKAAPRRTALPLAVPILALVGLAILGFYTVPAVAEHGRLERDHRRLEAEAHAGQSELDRLRRELRAERRQRSSQVRATRELLRDGAKYLGLRAKRQAEARASRTK